MVFDVYEDTSLQSIAETMVKGHIHRVFVTREKKVVGIVTALDTLRAVMAL
jgi:CBS domain-containing protein